MFNFRRKALKTHSTTKFYLRKKEEFCDKLRKMEDPVDPNQRPEEIAKQIEILKDRIQRPLKKEDLGALLEGDVLIEPKLGPLVYTEKYGEPRLVRQYTFSSVLRITIKEGEKSEYSINSDGNLVVEKGEWIGCMGAYSFVDYDLD